VNLKNILLFLKANVPLKNLFGLYDDRGIKDMTLELTDDQLLFLLEIIGQYHAVQWMNGDDNSARKAERLIGDLHKQIKKASKLEVFNKVFNLCEKPKT
jgi:hypothetical protein